MRTKPTSPETKANNPSTKKPTTHKKALKKPSKKSKTPNLNLNPPKMQQKSNALRPNSTTSSKSCTTWLSSQLKISKKANSSNKTNPTEHTDKIYWRQCTANVSTSNSKLKLFSCTFTSSIRLWKHPKAASSTCKAASMSATRAFSWHRSMKKSTLLRFLNGCRKTSIDKCTSGKARLFLRSILNWFMKVFFTFFSTGLISLRSAQLNARNVPRFYSRLCGTRIYWKNTNLKKWQRPSWLLINQIKKCLNSSVSWTYLSHMKIAKSSP